MTRFPNLSESDRLRRLQPAEGSMRIVLDTDTYNEIDDQFALVYALLSPERLSVEAVYAAPFKNDRAALPAEGMRKSCEEIARLYERLALDKLPPVFPGSTRYLDAKALEPSPAAADLIARALSSDDDDPLYIAAIGAITNVANAILLEPAIIERIVVIWLGGNALHWPHNHEFNLIQDVRAAQTVFDCGVPLVHIGAQGVASHLLTTKAEIDAFVHGRGAIGNYLAGIFAAYQSDHFGWSKVIWDIAVIGYLLNADWVPTNLAHSPILTDHATWRLDARRHFIRTAQMVWRDPIYRDLFSKLAVQAE